MKLRYKLGIIASGLLVAFLYGRCGKSPSGPNHRPVNRPSGDKEEITVDPIHHKLYIVTPQGVKTETFPDRKSTFEVKQNGTIKVTARQLGFETLPFVGLGFGNGLRGYAGADLFYFKRLDLGFGAITPKLNKPELTDTRIGVFVSYTVWDNTRFSIGYDSSRTLHALVSVRL